ncbi:MAG TPA: hypothetical protein VFD70_04785 [Anaerolineae bacterium]|nr:hypothetical protein [Anaerolineae bacterium]
MIHVRETTREGCIAMRAVLEKPRLTPHQVTPRGRIIGGIRTDLPRLFVIVCPTDTMNLE